MELGPHAVTSEKVAGYEPFVESLARRRDGVRGAEYDDLAQEGRIAVWEVLSNYPEPVGFAVENHASDRMAQWIRYVSREGMGGFDERLPNI